MSSTRAQDVLQKLSEIASELEHDFAQYSAVRAADSDDEVDSESPIFNSFYNAGGNQSVLKMTNFTAPEFRKLCGILHTTITTKWNNGRGKRSEYKQIDVLFILLVVMK